MAATARRRSAGKPARAKAGRAAQGRRTRSTTRAGRGGIRWDRVARLSLLIVLAAVVISYVEPAKDYLDSWRLAKQTSTQLHDLQTENAGLRERAKRLQDPNTIELEARGIGMAKPGERAYVIRHLPKN